MKMIEPIFNVINWDPNKHVFRYYNVMPYLLNAWKDEKKRKYGVFCEGKKPETFEDYKRFIDHASRYQYWSRCEYEVVLSDWPCQKTSRKIDVYYQIAANIDILTEYFMKYI